MGEHYPYIKFMSDIIDSGIWGELSSAAKTLYLVLLKFSDGTFKPVWPSTEVLLRLCGFKSKKSIIEAKKDLVRNGLIHTIPGTGHTSSKYFFCFDYPGSKIPPQGVNSGYPGGGKRDTPGEDTRGTEGGTLGNPNNINITITNNQDQGTKNDKNKLSFELLSKKFGASTLSRAIDIAEAKGLSDNLVYIQGICKNLTANGEMQNFKQSTFRSPSWAGFLEWVSEHLTRSTWERMKNMNIQVEGKTICILDPVDETHKMIITKYFTEEIQPPILVIFSGISEGNRIQSFI